MGIVFGPGAGIGGALPGALIGGLVGFCAADQFLHAEKF